MCQIEFALTQVVDRPVHGRTFFEEVLRENLDLGRPDNLQAGPKDTSWSLNFVCLKRSVAR
jgi:hypothetical protein